MEIIPDGRSSAGARATTTGHGARLLSFDAQTHPLI
jgi:hypothetical protein